MPLDFMIRFRCNKCGLEINQVTTINVKGFPLVAEKFGCMAPPTGWTVEGTEAYCMQHRRMVDVVHGVLPQ